MHIVRDLLDKELIDVNWQHMGRIDGLGMELRDGEQPRTRIHRVLVAFPDQSAITAGCITQGKSHGRNSSEVRPMRIGTPRGTGVGPLTRARSR